MTHLATRGRKARLAALATAVLTSLSLTALTGAGSPASAREKPHQIRLQILALNDFHGQLEALDPTKTSSGRINDIPAGGAEYLATHLQELRQQAAARGAASVTVAAGDLIGATPLLSAAFHDEPTIEAMNEMGLDVSSVGNHEFDEGWRELVRMQEGGCLDDGDGADNQNSCPQGDFPGADFQYLSANVFHEDTGDTVFPAYTIKKYDGVPVAFIGMTLENTPNIVTRSGVAGLRFADEVQTANALAERLQKQGVKSIVVLLHEGGYPADRSAYNSCPGISGPIVDINKGLSPKIDVLVTGHTHQAYNCSLPDPAGNPRLVTSGASVGRLVTDIELRINSRSGEVDRDSETADNVVVTHDVPASAPITDLISTYKQLVAGIENKVIGHLSGATSVSRDTDASGESALGNLIADAQRADASIVTGGKQVDVAFMNPGGIRGDLQADDAGAVTYGAAFTTQPFNNYDVSMDMTGEQILTLLDQQWSGTNASSPRILQVSGIEYAYTKSGGYALDPASVTVDGAPLDPARTYRVTANSFLADGGDGFSAFKDATDKYIGGLDIDALAAYLSDHDPYTPVATDRIDLLP